MNHRTRLLLAMTLLLVAGASEGALKAIEEAFELGLAQATLPATATGQLVVRPCAGCKPAALRVGPSTRYLVRPAVTTPLGFAEFTKAAARAAGRPAAMLFVYYDPETREVRRLVLDPGR